MKDQTEAEQHWLDYQQAARRVGRTKRTIRGWKQHGMPTILRDGKRYVDEEVLLTWWRARLQAWPAHAYRMRALRRRYEDENSDEAR